MSHVTRVTVSIEPELLERFDAWVADHGYANRSQGVRALVRDGVERSAWVGDDTADTVATVTYVYDHHRRDLLDRLAHLLHSHLARVVSTLHVHLDHQHCLEVTVLQGPAGEVRRIAEAIVSTKGVLRGSVSATVDRGLLAERHDAHGSPIDRPHSH